MSGKCIKLLFDLMDDMALICAILTLEVLIHNI